MHFPSSSRITGKSANRISKRTLDTKSMSKIEAVKRIRVITTARAREDAKAQAEWATALADPDITVLVMDDYGDFHHQYVAHQCDHKLGNDIHGFPTDDACGHRSDYSKQATQRGLGELEKLSMMFGQVRV